MRWLLGILLVVLGAGSAAANLITADIQGLAAGMMPSLDPVTFGYSTNPFSNRPFSAEFVFDDSLGIVSQPQPGENRIDGGLVSVSFFLQGDATDWGASFNPPGVICCSAWPGPAYLTWTDSGQVLYAQTGPANSYYHLEVLGLFQFGLCPGIGSPCGITTAITASSVVDPVPLPLAGSGWWLLAIIPFGLRKRLATVWEFLRWWWPRFCRGL